MTRRTPCRLLLVLVPVAALLALSCGAGLRHIRLDVETDTRWHPAAPVPRPDPPDPVAEPQRDSTAPPGEPLPDTAVPAQVPKAWWGAVTVVCGLFDFGLEFATLRHEAFSWSLVDIGAGLAVPSALHAHAGTTLLLRLNRDRESSFGVVSGLWAGRSESSEGLLSLFDTPSTEVLTGLFIPVGVEWSQETGRKQRYVWGTRLLVVLPAQTWSEVHEGECDGWFGEECEPSYESAPNWFGLLQLFVAL